MVLPQRQHVKAACSLHMHALGAAQLCWPTGLVMGLCDLNGTSPLGASSVPSMQILPPQS